MDRLLGGEDFDIPSKNVSDEARGKWRNAVGLVVKNRRRRFRHTTDLQKKSELEAKKKNIQEKIRVLIYVNKAALTFIEAGSTERTRKPPSEETRNAGFGIDADELALIARGHDSKKLRLYGGLNGIYRLVDVAPSAGVTDSSLSSRQDIFGRNRFIERPSRSFLSFVWDALQDLTLIILMVCAVVSGVVGLATEGWPKGMYDGLGIILSIFLVVLVTAISDHRQSLQFQDLDKEKKKINIQVTRDGFRQKVLIFDLVVGDIVHLNIGDQVPADGLFIKGQNLVVDESSLTGESEPVHITTEKPFLLSGTKVQDGTAIMLVTSVGMRTEWGRLMETLNQGGEDETPLQVKLNGVATVIGKIGLLFAILTFIVLLARFLANKAINVGLRHWYLDDALQILDFFATAVTIIVVAVPEGLPLAVTLSLAFAMKKLMEKMALVRQLSACETMGTATCICTDKTGTLTTNHMVVDKVWMCERSISSDTEAVNEMKSMMSKNVYDALLQCIFLNSGSEVVQGKDGKSTILGTPTETALLEFGLALGGDFDAWRKECTTLKMDPFNSHKKKMSVLASLPDGIIRSFCKGASEIILQMCDKIVDGNSNIVSMSEEQRNEASDVINSFANKALRTICIAFRDLDAATSGNEIPDEGYALLAVFGIRDPVRPGVKEAVDACRVAGITVRMVTGDNIYTAKAIARECGILTEDGLAIEGPEFRNLTPEKMRELVPKIQVLARSLPLDKHQLVTNLRGMFQEVVAVTGDGTNDAPALHEADIGFAMGIAGTEVCKENADIIVMDDNFSTIINVAKWGRAVYINIQKFVQFQLTVNVVALILNFFSACFTGVAPLTAVQLLWVNMIMDTLGALALATEPPDDEMMKRPPVGRNENFITMIMWRNVIGQSIYQLIVLGVLMYEGKNLLNISGPNEERILNTFIFNTFVFCQFFNEVNSREMEKINIFRGLSRSWIFIVILALTVIFQVIIVEFLGEFASTIPLNWNLWLFSVLIGFVSIFIGMLVKFIPVRWPRQPGITNPDGYRLLPNGPEDV